MFLMRRLLLTTIVAICIFLCGCSAQSLSAQATAARAHLAQQADELSNAMAELVQARQRLSSNGDPDRVGPEIEAGYDHVRRAAEANRIIARDFQQLNENAQLLQHQIEAHRNDLLGPRGRRIRNGVIIVAVLVAIGAALLQLGPIFGGPIGGVAIVAGHLLTAFIVPILKGLWWLAQWTWSEAALGVKSAVAALEKLGGDKAKAVTPQVAGANPAHATSASH
jgi:hypothetical protein